MGLGDCALWAATILRVILKCTEVGVSLEFVNIAHDYGDVRALHDISFAAPSGQITCLLGPSGCGKTTLLRLAAGLLDVQSGAVKLSGDVLADARRSPPPEKRPIGLVFQEGALFPHLTVAKNIAFGLERRGKPNASRIVDDLLEQMRLTEHGPRYPHMLSGGQRQRVALARAIAPAPDVLLLDEPFANVDIVLRRQLRDETRHILRQRGATAVLVTHDPEEAMEIADRIVVMDHGHVQQVGTPFQIYNEPQSIAVGLLFGQGQRVSGRCDEAGVMTPFGHWAFEVLGVNRPALGAMDLLVRPDDVRLYPGGDAAIIDDIRLIGGASRASVRSQSGSRIWVGIGPGEERRLGERVSVLPIAGRVRNFPA